VLIKTIYTGEEHSVFRLSLILNWQGEIWSWELRLIYDSSFLLNWKPYRSKESACVYLSLYTKENSNLKWYNEMCPWGNAQCLLHLERACVRKKNQKQIYSALTFFPILQLTNHSQQFLTVKCNGAAVNIRRITCS
jgi:hypothetical protein